MESHFIDVGLFVSKVAHAFIFFCQEKASADGIWTVKAAKAAKMTNSGRQLFNKLSNKRVDMAFMGARFIAISYCTFGAF